MTDESPVQTLPWWERTPPGQTVPLAFVKIDRKGATEEWADLSREDVARGQAQYTAGVETIARATNAALPLHWQDDGVMLFITDGDGESAPVRGFRAAKLLWERVRVDLNMPARIAVHAAHVAWGDDTGKLRHPAVDHCGHLETVAPENAIVATEDVYLALPVGERRSFAALGVSARDRVPAYVTPASARERIPAGAFSDRGDLDLWAAFRRYDDGRLYRSTASAMRIISVPISDSVLTVGGRTTTRVAPASWKRVMRSRSAGCP